MSFNLLRGSFLLLRAALFLRRFRGRFRSRPALPGSSEKVLHNSGVGIPGDDSGPTKVAIEKRCRNIKKGIPTGGGCTRPAWENTRFPYTPTLGAKPPG